MKYLKVFVLFLVIGLATAGISEAMMGYGPGDGAYGPGYGMMPGGSGMFGGGFMMTNNGSFGMMNGMAGAPVDGTAYLVTQNPTTTPGTVPDSGSFQSIITAVNPVGSYVTFALDGIVSRPVVVGNILVATASLPDFTNYTLYGPHMQNQSVLYAIALPLSPESTCSAREHSACLEIMTLMPAERRRHISISSAAKTQASCLRQKFSKPSGIKIAPPDTGGAFFVHFLLEAE
jgi:hypothetical protein